MYLNCRYQRRSQKGVGDSFVVQIDNLALVDVRALRKSPNKRYATAVQRLCIDCTEIMLSYQVSCRGRGAFWTGELEPFIFGTATTNHRASTALPLASAIRKACRSSLPPFAGLLSSCYNINVE